MLGAVTSSLIAAGIATGTAVGQSKVRKIIRRKAFSEELGEVATEFNQALQGALRDAAKQSEADVLTAIVLNWDDIAQELDSIDVLFESEEEGITQIVEAIETPDHIELNDAERRVVKRAVAAAYGDAVAAFERRIAGTDLEEVFSAEADIQIRRQLDALTQRLDELEDQFAPPERYELYDPASDIAKVREHLDTAAKVEFVDRPEYQTISPKGKTLVVGPAGAGKTRLLEAVLQRIDTELIEHILVPGDELNYPGDATALEQASFEGDVLLVWDDIHRITEARDNRVFEDVVTKLEANLVGDGHTLHTLVAARSGNLSDLPGDITSSEGLWAEFEIVELEPLDTDQLERLLERLAAAHNVGLASSTRERLLSKATDSASAPGYLEAALTSIDADRSLPPQVDALPDEIAKIWSEQHEILRKQDDDALVVLEACKILYDVGLPRSPPLVEGVYRHVLGQDKRDFRRAVEALVTRRFLTVPDHRDLLDADIEYGIQSTQLRAIDRHLSEWLDEFSTFLLEDVDDRMLRGTDMQPADAHSEFVFAVAHQLRRGKLAAEQVGDLVKTHFGVALDGWLATGAIDRAGRKLYWLIHTGMVLERIPIDMFTRVLDAMEEQPSAVSDDVTRSLKIQAALHSGTDPETRVETLYRQGVQGVYDPPTVAEFGPDDADDEYPPTPDGIHQLFGCSNEREAVPPDSDAYLRTVAAAVWVEAFDAAANPFELGAGIHWEFPRDEADRKQVIQTHLDQLSPSVAAVYTWAVSDDSAPTPADLRDQLDTLDDLTRHEIEAYERLRALSERQYTPDWMDDT